MVSNSARKQDFFLLYLGLYDKWVDGMSAKELRTTFAGL